MLLLASLLLLTATSHARDFTFVNQMGYTIWVGLQPNNNGEVIAGGGWSMDNGASVVQSIPDGWAGRFWGRTGCGNGLCATGDCGNGALECNGAGGEPPVTLAEITLNGDQNQDFYDVSLVDGFNIGVQITPQGGSGACATIGCTADVNANCPDGLRKLDADGNTIACWSSCGRTQAEADCCSGSYNDPNVCQPSESATYFKQQCPQAYSYAYDDATSTFTCTGANYEINFFQN
ncbi:hypothetical protein R5R35_005188 [Gryllus longicercus]|uniref:Thaumatin-like protein n=1 Tax=Gryllus longicercus TaxID=2509291 RepID=A0AAN9ZEW9_9ORTH